MRRLNRLLFLLAVAILLSPFLWDLAMAVPKDPP
jgi:hypothetical protein